jgi:CheY-like chemotaxis protein
MMPIAKILLLIVEDEMSLAEMYAERFKQVGFETDIAHEGEEGLEKMAAEHPSAVLMDIVMPGLSGTEAVEKAKANPATSNIPIIMLTNFADSIELKNAMQLGAADYIIKAESTPEQVVEKVQKILGGNATAPSLK